MVHELQIFSTCCWCTGCTLCEYCVLLALHTHAYLPRRECATWSLISHLNHLSRTSANPSRKRDAVSRHSTSQHRQNEERNNPSSLYQKKKQKTKDPKICKETVHTFLLHLRHRFPTPRNRMVCKRSPGPEGAIRAVPNRSSESQTGSSAYFQWHVLRLHRRVRPGGSGFGSTVQTQDAEEEGKKTWSLLVFGITVQFRRLPNVCLRLSPRAREGFSPASTLLKGQVVLRPVCFTRVPRTTAPCLGRVFRISRTTSRYLLKITDTARQEKANFVTLTYWGLKQCKWNMN